MHFDNVDLVNDALNIAFHPNGFEDDESADDESADDRLISLFTIFLQLVGWSEEEYWDEVRSRHNNCPHCKENNDEAESEDKSDLKSN